MKANIIATTVCCITLLFLVGFNTAPQDAAHWEYKVVEVRTTGIRDLQNAFRQHVKDGWVLDTPLVLPVDTNWNMSRCYLILKKQS